MFRRGELGCTSGDVLTGMVLTQCLKGSAQCFAEASWDVLTEMVLTQCLQGSLHQLRSNRF